MGLALLGLALAAAAAEPPPDDEAKKPETEIVVTGERVRRSLKDTPSSVVVFGQDRIDAQAANRLDQLLAFIPNVQLGNGSEGPAIRGEDSTGVLQALDGFLGGARPRATTEVDGRAVGFQEYVFGTAPVWDVKQVEVFRSPLTVTHGRNSIAGGIVITTNDPTYEWEARERVIAGNFQAREMSAVVSGPLAEDQLAFRLAGDIRHQRTTSHLSDQQRGADPNDDDYSILRFKLLGEPKAVPGLRLVGTFTHSYSRMPQVVDAKAPFHPRADPDFNLGVFGVRVNAATLHATQDLGDAQVEAVISHGNSHSRRFAPPSFGESDIRLNDLSGDLFGNWRLGDGFTLRGGVHALKSDLKQYIDLRLFIGDEGRFRDHQHSFGAFAEGEVAVGPRLKLSAGGRYQQDRQRRVGGLDASIPDGIEGSLDFDLKFSAWLPKIAASYEVTPSLNAGVLVERAYNPGGATIALDSGQTDKFGAEYLWDYEAFAKGTIPSLGLTVAANLFYQDKKDAQRGVLVPFTPPGGRPDFFLRFNNVPRSHTYGAELELRWRAAESLTLSAGLGSLHTKVDRAGAEDLIGQEAERAPHWSAAAAAEWSPLSRLHLSAFARFHSGYGSDNFDTKELGVKNAATIDARAAYDTGPFQIFAYAQNVFDSLHVIYRYSPPEYAELEDPRMIGVGIEAKF